MKARLSAGAYSHPDFLIIHAQRLSTAGFKVSTTPVFRLAITSSPEEIGIALRKALAGFQEGMPDPLDWKEFRENFLKATGLKSWKALEEFPARSCWISEEEGKVKLTPLKNGGNSGTKKGFQPFGREPLVISSDVADSELGEVLLSALKESE